MTDTTLLDLDADRLREECGVFGIFGHPDVAAITALGLHGFSTAARRRPVSSLSTVPDPIPSAAWPVGDARGAGDDRLPGNAAVGQVRYSTTGETILRNGSRCCRAECRRFAIGHNGT